MAFTLSFAFAFTLALPATGALALTTSAFTPIAFALTLAFTFAAKRKQYGEIIDCAPSRFLDELPPDDLAWEGNDDTPTEVKAVRGNTALADIRAMLKR